MQFVGYSLHLPPKMLLFSLNGAAAINHVMCFIILSNHQLIIQSKKYPEQLPVLFCAK